jgi:hypothetical protein
MANNRSKSVKQKSVNVDTNGGGDVLKKAKGLIYKSLGWSTAEPQEIDGSHMITASAQYFY